MNGSSNHMRILHKKVEYCSVCRKELKFKYKPNKSWEIEGKLCSDCHTSKMKEHMEKQQELKEQEHIKESYCSLCNIFIESDKKNPKWQWNMESNIVLCPECYDKKQKEYEKSINFCVSVIGNWDLLDTIPSQNGKSRGSCADSVGTNEMELIIEMCCKFIYFVFFFDFFNFVVNRLLF